MKTGNNKATNNMIIRLWSQEHYEEEWDNIFNGSVTEVKSGITVFFNNKEKMDSIIKDFYEKCEFAARVIAKKGDVEK